MASTGLNKSVAFKAYSKMNKSCVSGCHCTSTCQLYIAKEIILEAIRTGDIVLNSKFPSDILDIFKVLPIKTERCNLMELYDSFDRVQEICHNCSSETHSAYGKHCVANVVLTALGVLIYDNTYITEKDKEILLVKVI